MKFSIIVPVYNVEAYLPRCIDSLIHQTYTDIEIILIDDGSPDNCPQICDDYAKRDARITVIHQKNEGCGGAADARNKGLQKAAGEYVWFVDSDDYIELDACEKFACYAENGYDILLGDAFFEEVGGGSSFLFLIDVSTEVMNGVTFLKKTLKEGKVFTAVWHGPYRREFLLENKLAFQSGMSLEDFEFAPRAYLKAESVVCTQIPVYHYVRRENSQLTQKNQGKNGADILRACSQHEELFRKLQDEELKRLLMDWLLSMALARIALSKVYHYQAYIDKDFFKRNGYTRKNKWKRILLFISPRLYCCIMDLNSRFKIKQTMVSVFKKFIHPSGQ